MSLETGSRIADLVPTNPVGATDFASQGDDHIRLIKACLQGSFPSLGATAVALTGAQLNDAGRKSETQTVSAVWTFSAIPVLSAGINVSGGTVTLPAASVADAALSANIPLKNAANVFSQAQGIHLGGSYAAPQITLNSAQYGLGVDASGNVIFKNTNNGQYFFYDGAGVVRASFSNGVMTSVVGDNNVGVIAAAASGQIRLHGYHMSFGGAFVQIRNGANSAYIPVTTVASKHTLDGGPIVLSITYEGSVPAAGQPSTCFNLVNAGAWGLIAGTLNDGTCYVQAQRVDGTGTTYELKLQPNGGAVSVGGVNVKSLSLITSTSTALAKGQLHHISGNATLPALGDGEWVCIVNNSGSDIAITEHSGDTTYWSTGQVIISTVTLQARGRMFASGAGSSVVYVTGDITGYT